MSKKNKQDDLLKVFLVGEVYKAFNKHPNKTFNYKQLIRLIKSELPVFAEANPDINIDGLSDGLKKEILFILAELLDKGDLLEVEVGNSDFIRRMSCL